MRGVRLSLPVFLVVMLGWSWSQVLASHGWAPGENGPQKVNRLDSDQDPPSKAVQEWAPEDNASQKENRLDSDLDRSTKVTLHNPNAPRTKLFEKCIVRYSAYVRFSKLRFPSNDVVFTRYVLAENQLKIYNTSWQDLSDRSLNTSIACAQYAGKNSSVMMYKFNGTRCSVSTVRMPMNKEICGSKKADAVFVSSSCPEPNVQVTLTPAPGAMNISWIIDDPCNLTTKFKIDWVNVAGTNKDTVDKDVFQYRINGRLGCETQTVTVTALDSFSQPFGNLTSVSNDTLTRGPPTMASLNMTRYVDHLDVSWSIAGDECLRINEFVLTWANTSSYSGTVNLTQDTYSYTIDGLHGCLTISATIKAHYDAGAGTTNIIKDSTETLEEDAVIKNATWEADFHEVKINWELIDYCGKATDVKVEINSVGATFIQKSVTVYTVRMLPCDYPVIYKLTPVGIVGTSATAVGATVQNTSKTDIAGASFAEFNFPPDVTTGTQLSWSLVEGSDYECISAYRVTFGAGQTRTIPAKYATEATLSKYNACDYALVTVDMMNGPMVMDSVSDKRSTPPQLYEADVSLGFKQINITWKVKDDCPNSSIHHYKYTFRGLDYDTINSTAEIVLTDKDGCNSLSGTIDGVDSSGNSAVQSTLNYSKSTVNSCGIGDSEVDVCYACLHLKTTLPKFDKATAEANCQSDTLELYRPNHWSDVENLIALLAARLLPPANNGLGLYVDLLYNNTKWIWAGNSSIDETSSTNWIDVSHPNVKLGECSIMSGTDGFKLDNVDCASLQFSLCMKTIE